MNKGVLKKIKKYNRGFTLVEILLYIGIMSTILFVAILFLQVLVESRIKNQTIAEVEGQGLQIMQIITQTIRNSDNITTPTVGNSLGSITLDVSNVSNDPTVFDLSGGVVRVKLGSGSPINLNNSRVNVSSLNFQNFSRLNTPGIVRISFDVSYVNTSGRMEYNFTKSFFASASLRQP